MAQEQLNAMIAKNESNFSEQKEWIKIICNDETYNKSIECNKNPIKMELSLLSDESNTNTIEQHSQIETINNHFEFGSNLEGSKHLDNITSKFLFKN